MSCINDHANAAEQTRYHRNPPEECGRAVRLVCSYANNADDARELCTVLGLNPRDGRQTATPRISPVPGRPSIRAPSATPALGRRLALSPRLSADTMCEGYNRTMRRECCPGIDSAPETMLDCPLLSASLRYSVRRPPSPTGQAHARRARCGCASPRSSRLQHLRCYYAVGIVAVGMPSLGCYCCTSDPHALAEGARTAMLRRSII